MHRLEAVAHVGQGTSDDYGHGVIQERRPHLILDIDLQLSRVSGHTALS
jgi:hypothetical protein